MADNELRYVITALDKSGAAVASAVAGQKSVEAAAKAMGAAVGAANAGAVRSFGAPTAAAKAFGGGLGALEGVASRVTSSIQASFGRMGDSIRHVAEHAIGQVLGNALTNVGRLAGQVFRGIEGEARSFEQMGIAFDRMKENQLATLSALLKSRAAAEDLFDFSTKFAAKSPFEASEIQAATVALTAFGFEAKSLLPIVSDTATAMRALGVSPTQVVRILGEAKSGIFSSRQGAEIGLSKDDLGKAGLKFSDSGEIDPSARGNVLPAVLAAMQKKFGGTTAAASTGFEALQTTMTSALKAFSGKAVEGLFESIKKAMGSFAEAIDAVVARGKLVESLRVIFDSIGKALEWAASKAGDFFGWVEKVASADGLRMFLINSTALLQTLSQSFLQFFGVDLKKLTDPKNMAPWFDAVEVGIETVVHTFFGLGRVWREVVLMGQESWRDLFDSATDFTNDLQRAFQRMFNGIETGFHSMVENALRSFATVMDAFGKHEAAAGLRAGADQEAAAKVRLQGEAESLDYADQNWPILRQQREAAKDQIDPHRHDAAGKRIAEAFSGSRGDAGDEVDFWKRFNENRTNATKFFFAGADATKPQWPGLPPGVPPSPNMVGPGTVGMQVPPGMTGPNTWFTAHGGQPGGALAGRQGVTPVPGAAVPSYGNNLPAGGAYDFSPVTLPDGRVMSRYGAQVQGLLPDQGPSVSVSAGKARLGAEGGTDVSLKVSVDMPPVVPPEWVQRFMNSPEFGRQFQDWFRALFDREFQQALPGQ